MSAACATVVLATTSVNGAAKAIIASLLRVFDILSPPRFGSGKHRTLKKVPRLSAAHFFTLIV